METSKLENKLTEVLRTILELEELKTDIKFISDKDEEYFELVVKNSYFLRRVYQNSIKLFVINICKLLNPNEDFSLIKILNYALSNRNRIHWSREISANKLKILADKIENIKENELPAFKYLRDKHYVHNDKNKNDFESKVTLLKCWNSLSVVEEVFIELNLCFMNEQYIFPMFCKNPMEIVSLTKYHKIEKYILSELQNNPDIGSLQKIRSIILGK